MAYFGMILSVFSVVLRCINMMATGHRAMMVKTPTKGLIHMAAPVMFIWKEPATYRASIKRMHLGSKTTYKEIKKKKRNPLQPNADLRGHVCYASLTSARSNSPLV